MTEKRFKLDSEVGFIDTQKCGGDTMTLFEVVVELNKLNEENEQLKENCKNYNWYKQYKTLLKENEQLKHRIKKLQNDLDNYSEIFNELNGLIDENEQLKKQCKDFIEMLDDMSVAYLINDGLEEILND